MKTFFAWLIFLNAVVAPAYALERFEIVTTQELKELLDERTAGKVEFTLVNTLDRMIFEHHAIPGSVNLPLSQVAQAARLLGPDKDLMLITY